MNKPLTQRKKYKGFANSPFKCENMKCYKSLNPKRIAHIRTISDTRYSITEMKELKQTKHTIILCGECNKLFNIEIQKIFSKFKPYPKKGV